MAFTRDELLRGGVTVWLLFLFLLLSSEAVHLPILALTSGSAAGPASIFGGLFLLILIGLIGGGVSAVAMCLALPLIRLLAHLLRRVTRISLHVAVYSLVGIAIGWASLALLRGGHAFAALTAWDYFVVLPAVAAAIAVPVGWWWTAHRALRRDAGLIPPRLPKTDPDARHEDQAIDTIASDT